MDHSQHLPVAVQDPAIWCVHFCHLQPIVHGTSGKCSLWVRVSDCSMLRCAPNCTDLIVNAINLIVKYCGPEMCVWKSSSVCPSVLITCQFVMADSRHIWRMPSSPACRQLWPIPSWALRYSVHQLGSSVLGDRTTSQHAHHSTSEPSVVMEPVLCWKWWYSTW